MILRRCHDHETGGKQLEQKRQQGSSSTPGSRNMAWHGGSPWPEAPGTTGCDEPAALHVEDAVAGSRAGANDSFLRTRSGNAK
jgi:hypothetical protein